MNNLLQTKNTGINPVYQTVAASNTSDKYKLISSENIVKFFESAGFTLDGVSHAGVRNKEKQGFQKHIMLFSRPDLLIDGGNKIQILALNTHDASSSLRLNIGVYRAVCANGLIAGNELFESRVIHIGNFEEKLQESLHNILKNVEVLKEQVLLMQSKTINFHDAQNYLESMVKLRLKDVADLSTVDLSTVDRVRRTDDKANDVYTFFNRVQESVIKGGIKYVREVAQFNEDKSPILGPNGETVFKLKNNTTREIKDFNRSIEMNKALWDGALKLAA